MSKRAESGKGEKTMTSRGKEEEEEEEVESFLKPLRRKEPSSRNMARRTDDLVNKDWATELGVEDEEDVEQTAEMEDTELRVWSCPICSTKIEEKERNTSTFCKEVNRHLQTRHQKEVKKRMREHAKFGAYASGLGIREITKPIQAADLPHDQRWWTCPVCDKGLPEVPSRWQREMSKRLHLAEHGIGMKEAFQWKRKNMQGTSKFNMAEWTRKSKEEKSDKGVESLRKLLGPYGHNIVKLRITWPKKERAKAKGKPEEISKEPRRGYYVCCSKCRREAKPLARKAKKDLEQKKRVGMCMQYQFGKTVLPKEFGKNELMPKHCWWAKYTSNECHGNVEIFRLAWSMTKEEIAERAKIENQRE
eukprot:4634039-Karenia_brevis.AAC.1